MSPLKELFANYVAELHVAKDLATKWWDDLMTAEAIRTGSREEAERIVTSRWPYGAASHPYVIATFRKYYIACEQLNEELQAKVSSVPVEALESEDEADWGAEEDSTEDDDLWADDDPIRPDIVLIEALSGRDDELAEFMEMYMFSCLGEIDNRTV
jgi:hypothetical protein